MQHVNRCARFAKLTERNPALLLSARGRFQLALLYQLVSKCPNVNTLCLCRLLCRLGPTTPPSPLHPSPPGTEGGHPPTTLQPPPPTTTPDTDGGDPATALQLLRGKPKVPRRRLARMLAQQQQQQLEHEQQQQQQQQLQLQQGSSDSDSDMQVSEDGQLTAAAARVALPRTAQPAAELRLRATRPVPAAPASSPSPPSLPKPPSALPDTWRVAICGQQLKELVTSLYGGGCGGRMVGGRRHLAGGPAGNAALDGWSLRRAIRLGYWRAGGAGPGAMPSSGVQGGGSAGSDGAAALQQQQASDSDSDMQISEDGNAKDAAARVAAQGTAQPAAAPPPPAPSAPAATSATLPPSPSPSSTPKPPSAVSDTTCRRRAAAGGSSTGPAAMEDGGAGGGAAGEQQGQPGGGGGGWLVHVAVRVRGRGTCAAGAEVLVPARAASRGAGRGSLPKEEGEGGKGEEVDGGGGAEEEEEEEECRLVGFVTTAAPRGARNYPGGMARCEAGAVLGWLGGCRQGGGGGQRPEGGAGAGDGVGCGAGGGPGETEGGDMETGKAGEGMRVLAGGWGGRMWVRRGRRGGRRVRVRLLLRNPGSGVLRECVGEVLVEGAGWGPKQGPGVLAGEWSQLAW